MISQPIFVTLLGAIMSYANNNKNTQLKLQESVTIIVGITKL